VGVVFHPAVVINGSPGIDDAIVTDDSTRPDHGAGADDRPGANPGEPANLRPAVNGRNQGDPRNRQSFKDPAPCPVVTDGHHHPVQAEPGPILHQASFIAQDWPAARPFPAGSLVKKTRRFHPAALQDQIEDNPAVAPGAHNPDFQGGHPFCRSILCGPENLCHQGVLFSCPGRAVAGKAWFISWYGRNKESFWEGPA
jgi:hypothetical protein